MFIVKAADHDIGLSEKLPELIVIIVYYDMIVLGLRITKDDDPIVFIDLNIVYIDSQIIASSLILRIVTEYS